ncbi:MAG: aminotransferase class I/II-fold pyridoxal phosphate-dependent enzyme, partial [Polaribacter sp.]
EKKIASIRTQSKTKNFEIYVVTESVFSMDGDTPEAAKMVEVCKKHSAFLIIDEAHAVGVFGENGCGIVQELNLQNNVFARIITFGKALGCHGAVILGSKDLQTYLVNFARSFIYTTGLSPHSLATIKLAYKEMLKQTQHQEKLAENIRFFNSEIEKLQFPFFSLASIKPPRNREILKKQWGFIKSNSSIHSCIIFGNEKVKNCSQELQKKGFDVKAILSPTVPKNKERLRFCLHSYNSTKEISEVLCLLSRFAKLE